MWQMIRQTVITTLDSIGRQNTRHDAHTIVGAGAQRAATGNIGAADSRHGAPARSSVALPSDHQAGELPPSARRVCRRAAVMLALAGLIAAGHGRAWCQVTTDGTLGTTCALTGPHYQIAAACGQQSGTNLFHSFASFDLEGGESATFLGPVQIRNVIGRVTGPQASSINGRLHVAISGANLVLVNPHGISLGPDARLPDSGSFTATTAHVVDLGPDGRFNALDPAGSVLSTAPPSAFGFLGPEPAAVTIDRSTLAVADGQVLSVVGGDVLVDRAKLQAPGGRISLIATATGGRVQLDVADPSSSPDTSSLAELGQLRIKNRSRVRVDGSADQGGGLIVVRAGRLHLDRSDLTARTDDADGRGIDLRIAGDLLMPAMALISTRTSGSGSAGSVQIEADSVQIGRRSFISADTAGAGAGGYVGITAGKVVIDGTGSTQFTGVKAHTLTAAGAGPGGNIHVQADSVTLAGSAQLSVVTSGAGQGGRIDIQAGQVAVGSGAQVIVQTTGSGHAGAIDITTSKLELTGAADTPTGVFADTSSESTGDGGNITVHGGTLTILDAAVISATTNGTGDGGSVQIAGVQDLTVHGRNVPEKFTGIAVNTQADGGGGTGGNLTVKATWLRILDGGGLAANTFGDGDGGNISAQADQITIDDLTTGNLTGILAQSIGDASGARGNLQITADRLIMRGNAVMSARSEGSGNAGNITVNFTERFAMRQGSRVTASAKIADGGDILINGGTAVDLAGGVISAEAGNNGGNITLLAQDRVRIVRSRISGLAGKDGAKILIDPLFVILEQSVIDGRAGGQDVLITIDPNAIYLNAESQILTTTSSLPPELDLAGTLVALPGGLLAAEARLQPRCAVKLQAEVSSFIVTSGGGMPNEPGPWLPSYLIRPVNAPRSELKAPVPASREQESR